MKRIGKKKKAIIISTFLVIALIVGVFTMITSYRMSLIPSMSFEEMLSYTTKNNGDAIITVGIIKDGEESFTVYGENATVLPNNEFEYEIGSVTKTFSGSFIIWHNGGTSNFNSYIAFDKEKQLGVVILSNLSPSYRIPATVMGSKLIITLQNKDS